MAEPILLSWSGGKDSAYCLHELTQSSEYEVAGLLTTITRDYDRISMHGVRRALLEQQAESLGLRLHEVHISKGAGNEEYESRMKATLAVFREHGVDTVAFGDLFLEDIRAYREKLLTSLGMKGLFPLWKRDTSRLARTFIDLGFKAIVVCVDPKVLDRSFVGKVIDDDFLRQLPAHVDPCGENGEFHTFVFAGPLFKEEVRLQVGETVWRDGFYFCDLLPM